MESTRPSANSTWMRSSQRLITLPGRRTWSYGDHFIFGTSGLAAAPGYPIVQVPAGVVFGVPLGISFFGTAFSEPTLIKLASGYEAATKVRAHNLPTFAGTIPSGHIQGTTIAGRGVARSCF